MERSILEVPDVKAYLNKIRFAIPSVDLCKAVFPLDSQVSERKYRKLTEILLNWPFGRALIFSPREFTQGFRSEEDLEVFLQGIDPLRALVVSRAQVNAQRKWSAPSDVDDDDLPSEIESPPYEPLTPPGKSKKKEKKKDLSRRVDSLESKLESIQDNVQKLVDSLGTQRSTQREIQEEDDPSSAESEYSCDSFSPVASTGEEQRPNAPESLLGQSLWSSTPAGSSAPSFLNPVTFVKEPDVKLPEADLLETAINCQRLGKADWSGVRYSEAEKRLKRGAVFQPLVMNTMFASKTGVAELSLRRQEGLLGSLTYGLLAQRKAFVEAQDSLLRQFPQASKAFDELFLGESSFRSSSDDLLQITCGRRAEVIAERRKLVEPSDLVSKRALLSVPPSPSHVFDEEQLTKLASDPHIRLRNQEFRFKKRSAATSVGGWQAKRPRPSLSNLGERAPVPHDHSHQSNRKKDFSKSRKPTKATTTTRSAGQQLSKKDRSHRPF